MIILYGINNCDSVKKAKRFLTEQTLDFEFHDFRKDGLTLEHIQHWLTTIDWQTLLNRRGRTWKQLDTHVRDHLTQQRAIDLMLQHPTLIKRPVLLHDKGISVGFNEENYQSLVDAKK